MKRPANITEFYQTAPSWLKHAYEAMSRWHKVDWATDYAENRDEEDDIAADNRVPANSMAQTEVFGSKYDDVHIVQLDLDIQAALIPSSTEGNFHLVLNHHLEWDDYKRFLKVCAEVGIINQGYYTFAVARGETYLRAPWVTKGEERKNVADANARWLLDPEFDLNPVPADPIPVF